MAGHHRELEDLKAAVMLAGEAREQVLPQLERLGELEPDEPRWPLGAGDGHAALGDRAAALAAYKRALGLYTQQGQALAALGDLIARSEGAGEPGGPLRQKVKLV